VERNAIALRVMADLRVAVNDLYTVAFTRLEELQRPQNVHFTDEGSRALAVPVATTIREQLQP
jgi:acyl-CoA thioesterase-1